MSEKMTIIEIPGAQSSFSFLDHGEVSAQKMIEKYRRIAARKRAEAEEIEGALDQEFSVRVVRGLHVQRHVRTLQEGQARAQKERDQ